MNGGDIIAKVLRKHGVEFLFTLSGGHISSIYVGAEREGIRVIDTRHEANAVFAADAVSRLTNIPGVATVTAGPGVTNTVTAVKNAAMAHSPLILLGGAAATILKGRGSLQDIDQISILKSICKWSASIKQVSEIIPTIEKAFWKAKEGVPGPVFVECPIDILYDKDIVKEWYVTKGNDSPSKNLKDIVTRWYLDCYSDFIFKNSNKISFETPIKPIDFPKFHSFHIDKALNMLATAKKPLFIIGSGALLQPDKVNELATAIKKLGIPAYLSGMARGLLGKDNPLLNRHKRRDAIKEADLIILAGVPNDFRLDYGYHIGYRKFISINRSRSDLYLNKRPTLPVLSDPLDFIVELSKRYTGNYPEWQKKLLEINQAREDDIAARAKENVKVGINPLELFRTLEPMLNEDTILIADGGDFVATASYILKPSKPLSWLDPGVYGTLGVGAGFALGAKLVHPEKDVWIIYGDGSAGYSMIEYDTFNRFNLPIVSVIGNDACWSQIARDQVEILGSDCALNLDYSEYQMIAQAFKGDGERVETIEDFKQSVRSAQKANTNGQSYVINAIIGVTDFRKGSISV